MKLRNKKGVTVIELIVAAAILITVILVSINLFSLGKFSGFSQATVWKPGCINHNFRESTSHPGVAYCVACLKTARIEFVEEVSAKKDPTNGR